MSISEQIDLLVELQKMDTKIYALESKKKAAPIRIQKLEEDFRNISGVLKENAEQLTALKIRQKDKENELAAKEEVIKKCRVQLYQIKTNKEYTAMQQEISGHEADKSKLEDEIISLLDEIEDKKKETEKKKSALKEREKQLSEDKEKINSEIKEIAEQLNVLSKERSEAAAKIDKTLLSKYEKILHGKNGSAMVPVTADSCGGCHMNLPPQVINEIKMETNLIFCGSCARILYIEK